MNKAELLNLLGSYIEEEQLYSKEYLFDGVTTRLQNSNEKTIVFYHLNEGKKFADLFYSRYKDSKRPLIILSGVTSFLKDKELSYIKVAQEKVYEVQKILCDYFYRFSKLRQPKLIAITGTNGKTTTAFLSTQISEKIGYPALSIGTLGVVDSVGRCFEDLGGTTPSYVELRRILHQYGRRYKAFFIEISSHALLQNRVYDLRFDAGAWTSFSQDHLDYHPSMEDYFEAKCLLHEVYLKKKASLFIPSSERTLINLLLAKTDKIKLTKSLSDFSNLDPFFLSQFNKNNLELALSLNEEVWGPLKNLDCKNLKPPPGRFSIIPFKDALVIIDYAHTPDALKNICSSLKLDFPKYSLSVLFGCGGDRDRKKRPLMGEIASQYADKIILTSDNPRSEEPIDIINEIKNGIKNFDSLIVEPDRKLAIQDTMKSLGGRQILLIAGKGHEDYQEIRGERLPYSDYKTVQEFMTF